MADDLWAGLIRVSHMGRRKANAPDFHSERDQLAALQTAANGLGGRLEVLPSELDVSGGLPLEQRPSLRRAVEGVEAGRYRGIIVAYQSRLGRDVEQEEAVWRRVEAAGGRVELALDGLDTTTVDGKMVRRIRSAMNAAERERHVERFDNLRRWATAAGIWQRRQTPTGYSRDPATRRLVPDADAELVRRAFRWRAAAVPVTRIADELDMTTSGVRQLLRNRVYLGELRVGSYVNVAAHPPVVSAGEFAAAQVTGVRPGRRGDGAPALLAGLIRCQACGHVLSRSKAKVWVYSHPTTSSARGCPAPASVTMALVDAHVEAIAVAELRRLAVSATEESSGVDEARRTLEAAERELDAYLEAVSAADVGPAAFRAHAQRRRDVVDAARRELERAVALRPALPAYGSGADVWGALDATERNALLRGLLEVVVLRRAGGRGARAELSGRVRVVAHGAGVFVAHRGGGVPAGVRPIAWPDVDAPGVLGVPGGQDRL